MTSIPNLPVVMDRPFGQFTTPVESEHKNDIEDADTEPSDDGYSVTPVDQPRGRPHGKQPLLARPYHPAKSPLRLDLVLFYFITFVYV